MKKIGVKQFLILKECFNKGFVWTADVIDIYNIPHNKNKQSLIELKKLEIYGYLNQDKIDYRIFRLSKSGEDFVVSAFRG